MRYWNYKCNARLVNGPDTGVWADEIFARGPSPSWRYPTGRGWNCGFGPIGAAAKMRLAQIVEEVVALLASNPLATLNLTLIIKAEFPGGVSGITQRTISENAACLYINTRWTCEKHMSTEPETPAYMIKADHIDEAVARYERERDRYDKLVTLATEQCLALIRRKGIRATVSGRSKTPESLRKKLLKYQREIDQRYKSVDDVFAHMPDLAAVRITTYLESDRSLVQDEVAKTFDLLVPPLTKDSSNATRGKHYRAIHCSARLRISEEDDSPDSARLENIAETRFEIQICSMLAHVWNEIEHDIGYKPEGEHPEGTVLDSLEILGQLVRAGDHVVHALIAADQARVPTADDDVPFTSDRDFEQRMRRFFPDAENFSWFSAQLLDALLELRLDSPKRVRSEILDSGEAYKKRAADLIAAVNAHQSTGARMIIALDPLTSDALAALLFDKKLDAFLAKHPTGRGRGRPSRLVSIAKRFQWMRDSSTGS